MKKLLTAVLALSAATTFAANENMVRMYGWDAGNRATSFDVSMSGDDAKEAGKKQRIALNYARAFGQWQVGLTYVTQSEAEASATSPQTESDYTTIGLSGYYNLDADLANTGYVALHYNTHTTSDGGDIGTVTLGKDDTATTIALEYGQRWSVGSAWGLNLTYAPSVMYSMTTVDYDADASADAKGEAHTDLAWNFLKFDVMF